jgi:hypothetical protein
MAKVINAQPPKFEWRVYRNDTTSLTMAALNDDGSPFDLTDYTIQAEARLEPTATTTVGTITVTAQDNIITLDLDTTGLDVINYFDVEVVHVPTEKKTTILYGTIFVEEDVTR